MPEIYWCFPHQVGVVTSMEHNFLEQEATLKQSTTGDSLVLAKKLFATEVAMEYKPLRKSLKEL
eukprot:12817960-Prorocentrum_lima.AAC.1